MGLPSGVLREEPWILKDMMIEVPACSFRECLSYPGGEEILLKKVKQFIRFVYLCFTCVDFVLLFAFALCPVFFASFSFSFVKCFSVVCGFVLALSKTLRHTLSFS